MSDIKQISKNIIFSGISVLTSLFLAIILIVAARSYGVEDFGRISFGLAFPELFTFIYAYLTPVINDVCYTTIRFTPFADKKYHAHFEFDKGWCKVRLLTLINEGTEKESWKKYLFAKSNDDFCIDKSDLNLLKKKQLR